ncbi:HK97 gp10 family phage protein [Bacillus sp. FJAT-49705]|uniref:HK97 gp10 family phage protein n=1 Tax=Cytobacillus citreus TaxID=2833586 RepID=A0ABS5NLF9_9BACI|nr:HK97-gp10 family putative phage morphogenesis protein [Cytobacillus citreus]MBS4188650.1 HK97 gp10 family phage protein [Cytobacillus citreus]
MTGIQLQGMDQLLRRLETMSNQAEVVKEKALMKGAEHLKQEISNNAPTGPGSKHIKDNIVIEKKMDKVLVGPERSYFYGHFIEFGFYNVRVKRHISARPFMAPSFENNVGQIQRIMADEISRELRL